MTRAFLFLSVKGGVGKTSLAVAAGAAFSKRGHPVAIVDADFTGTSVADGLPLSAPTADGGWLTEEATRSARRTGEPLAWFDRSVLGGAGPIPWLHRELPAVQWYPSSPRPDDVERSTLALYRPNSRLPAQLGRAFRTIADQLGPEGVLCVDLPPSLGGLATVVAEAVQTEHLGIVPVLVSTDDRNDLYRSVLEFERIVLRFPWSRWLLNRSQRTPAEVRADLRDFLAQDLPGVESKLKSFSRTGELAGLFTRSTLELGDAASRLLALLEED